MSAASNDIEPLSDNATQCASLTAPSDVTATEFTIFNKIAPELRVKIWRFAAFQLPRKVHVGITPVDDGTTSKARTTEDTKVALLSVNCESREEGLKHYYVLFEGPGTRSNYFNSDIDTLRLSYIEFPTWEHTSDIMKVLQPSKIKKLEVDMWLWSPDIPSMQITMRRRCKLGARIQNASSKYDLDIIPQSFQCLDHLVLVIRRWEGEDQDMDSLPWGSCPEKTCANASLVFSAQAETCPEIKIPTVKIAGWPKESASEEGTTDAFDVA